MALENHSSVMATAAQIRSLIDTVGSPQLRTCPDPTNFVPGVFENPSDGHCWERVYAETKLVAPLAAHAHIKYAGLTGGDAWAGYDLQRLRSLYARAGYDRAMAIEPICKESLLDDLAQARRILERELSAPP